MRLRSGFAWFLSLACQLILVAPPSSAASPSKTLFDASSPVRAIRYTFPDSSWPGTLPPLCAMARDLPLVRESGANAVYTVGAPPEDGDHIFLSLLASTGLSWIAAYPLPQEVDPSRPLLEQREAIRTRFAAFVTRFQGNPNLRGVVLDFGSQYAVEAAILAPEFAAELSRRFPENPPALGQAAYTPDALYNLPTGTSFWLYRFTGNPPTNLDRSLLSQRTGAPILFDLSPVVRHFTTAPVGTWQAFLSGFAAGGGSVHMLAAELVGSKEVSSSISTSGDGGGTSTLSTIRYRDDALFMGKRDPQNFENLQATTVSSGLRAVWQALPLGEFGAPPELAEIRNAATQTAYLSPGTRIEFRGSLFGGPGVPHEAGLPDTTGETASGPEWPLHAGASCLCVGDRPVAIGSRFQGEGTAQLPWLVQRGLVPARFVREGVASAPKLIEVLDFSPGIFPRQVQRTDAGCSAQESDGVRAGETIQIEATGAGLLNGDLNSVEVFLHDTPAQLLEAGLSTDAFGLASLRVRLPEKVVESDRKGLYLRKGLRASNVIPMEFVGNARPTVSLVAERPRVLLQPGGLSAPLRIDTRGLNGYCGRVEFSVEGLPAGVTAILQPVQAGQPASLQLRATSTVEVVEKKPIYVYALPTPGDVAILSLELRVMPQVGAMAVRLESRGFGAGASASILWNGELLPPTGPKAARGIYLQIIDPRTGVFFPIERYDVWESKEESVRLEVRLNSLRSGVIVGMAIADEGTLHMQPSLRSWIQTKLGSTAIGTLGYQHSWAILSKVGAAAPIAESASATGPAVAQSTLPLPEK